MQSPAEHQPFSSRPPISPGTWWTIIVLFVMYVVSFADRQVISMLVVPIKADLHLSDFQISLLMGLAFSLLYAVTGLPVGRLADTVSRRLVIWVGATAWALSACACGLAQSVPALLLARAGVGIGEATLPSSANSLIADKTPRARLSFALSLFATGTSVGDAVSYTLSGVVLSALKHTPTSVLPLIGTVKTWQLVFLMTGIPGLLLAPLVFTFSEPARKRAAPALPGQARPPGFGAWLARHRKLAVCYALSFCLMGMVPYAAAQWTPTYIHRAFGWSPAQYGLALGLIFPVAAIAGHIVSGRLVDGMVRRGHKDAQMRFFMYTLMFCAPVVVVGYLIPNVWVFLASLTVSKAIMTPYLGYAMAGLLSAAPQAFRAQTAALFMLTLTLLGGAIGPSLIACVTDFVFHDEQRLGWSLALVVAGCAFIAVIALAVGRPALARAVTESESMAPED